MAYSGKVALVTGGGSGMGRIAAQNCARTGAAVAILDLNEAGMAETAAGFPNIHAYSVDITDAERVQSVVDQVESALGFIDRVYNAAGVMPFGKLLDQDTAMIRKIMDINFGGLVHVSKATLPGMISRGAGEFISFGRSYLLTAQLAAPKFVFCSTAYLV